MIWLDKLRLYFRKLELISKSISFLITLYILIVTKIKIKNYYIILLFQQNFSYLYH